MKAFYLMHDYDWLKKNAYQDIDADWWQDEADFHEFESRAESDRAYAEEDLVYSCNIGRLMTEEEYITESKESMFDWALEKIYTKEEYPEMFL